MIPATANSIRRSASLPISIPMSPELPVRANGSRVRMGGTQYYPFRETGSSAARRKSGKSGASTEPQNQRTFLHRRRHSARVPICRHWPARHQQRLIRTPSAATDLPAAPADLATPTPLSQELGLKAHIFTDAGNFGQPGEQDAGRNHRRRRKPASQHWRRHHLGIAVWAGSARFCRADFVQNLRQERTYPFQLWNEILRKGSEVGIRHSGKALLPCC